MSSALPDPVPSDLIPRLRNELKAWEHAFAKAHDGRKPTREETKKDTEIAAKYREYSRLRAGPSKPSTTTKKHTTPPRPTTTPTKSRPPTETPTRSRPSTFTPAKTPTTTNNPWTADVYDTPQSVRRQRGGLFGRRDQVGPTPQKTGRIMGIFDTFIDVESTPPRPLSRRFAATAATPDVARVSASPRSLRKEPDASPFLTPRKRKLEEEAAPPADFFATPAALRRSWKPPASPGLEGSPQVRRPPPMPRRGLSSMLKELRELENHALDDEEEAMREMEEEEMAEAEAAGPAKKKVHLPVFDEPELPPLPPGAYVDETLVDEDEGVEKGDAPRVWKKKGLKRQHRRVIMRPVVVKPLDATDNPEEEAGLEEDQMSIPSDIENGIDPAEDNPDDYEDIEDDATKSGRKAKVVDKEESKTRKIQPNAVSHMNFRRLNIKNKNSKGRGRGGGFGRRRR